MKAEYELIVFDWEGTLGDPLGHIIQLIEEQSNKLNITHTSMKEIRRYVSLGLERALKKIFPTLTLHQHEHLLEELQYTLQHRTEEPCLFAGARTLLTRLKQMDIRLAIATNKGPQSLMRVMEATHVTDLFDVTRAAGQAPSKPCPQMLEEILDICQVSARKTLVIGDSVSDMEMAKALNIEAIGVDFYHQQKDALLNAGARAVFDDYAQVGCFLKIPEYIAMDGKEKL